ncbi:MAG: ATP-dependent DNA helicase [Candidatus Delongbacteria bacterium]
MPEPVRRLAVQALCELAEGGRNDGGGWIPGRARQGQRLHGQAQQRALAEGARVEVPLSWRGVLLGEEVELTGRADQLDEDGTVEEIKTVLVQAERLKRLRAEDFPGHVLQALLYAWMLKPTGTVRARLRLINLGDGAERVLDVERPADELLATLETQVALLAARERRENELRAARVTRSRQLEFPFPAYRPGQRVLMQEIETALAREQILTLNAPTGLGKSVSVLLPALRTAMQAGRRVFFCTAKNTGREAALLVARALNREGTVVSAVAMSSREGMCPAETYFCHEEHCPLLKGLAPRLEAALRDLAGLPLVDREELVATGIRHRVCPHEIALALTETRDLVVGDYNYVFDPQVRIRRLFVEGDPQDFVLVVDEAHNLAPRGRSWFSASLAREQLGELERHLDVQLAGGDLFQGGPLQRPLKGLKQALHKLDDLFERVEEQVEPDFEFVYDTGERALGARFDQEVLAAAAGQYERALVDLLLTRSLLGVVVEKDPIVDFFRELERFAELARQEKETLRQVIRVLPGPERPVLIFEILCTWAGDWIQEQLERFHAAVLFSATLRPWDWHLGELGLNQRPRVLTLAAPSPFPPEHRNLIIFEGISSRWRDRSRGLPLLGRLVAESFRRVGGNTAVFLPSFAYLRALRRELPAGLPLLVHEGSLEPLERLALLKKLERGGPRLLLTVMGGIFAEAVDYPGRMLEAALVIGPGLPQLSHERELARLWYESQGDGGFDKAYRLPGLCRVLQAAGRVIRRPEDRGSIVLFCDRFSALDNLQVIEEFYDARPLQLELPGELLDNLECFHGTGG